MTGTPAADTEADAITRRLTDDQRIRTRLATIEQPREVGASLASERTGRLDSRRLPIRRPSHPTLHRAGQWRCRR